MTDGPAGKCLSVPAIEARGISKHFGAKTHSTAVAAEKKVRDWISRDERVLIGDRDWRAKEIVDRIERELQR